MSGRSKRRQKTSQPKTKYVASSPSNFSKVAAQTPPSKVPPLSSSLPSEPIVPVSISREALVDALECNIPQYPRDLLLMVSDYTITSAIYMIISTPPGQQIRYNEMHHRLWMVYTPITADSKWIPLHESTPLPFAPIMGDPVYHNNRLYILQTEFVDYPMRIWSHDIDSLVLRHLKHHQQQLPTCAPFHVPTDKPQPQFPERDADIKMTSSWKYDVTVPVQRVLHEMFGVDQHLTMMPVSASHQRHMYHLTDKSWSSMPSVDRGHPSVRCTVNNNTDNNDSEIKKGGASLYSFQNHAMMPPPSFRGDAIEPFPIPQCRCDHPLGTSPLRLCLDAKTAWQFALSLNGNFHPHRFPHF
jgi:hypothetical protein